MCEKNDSKQSLWDILTLQQSSHQPGLPMLIMLHLNADWIWHCATWKQCDFCCDQCWQEFHLSVAFIYTDKIMFALETFLFCTVNWSKSLGIKEEKWLALIPQFQQYAPVKIVKMQVTKFKWNNIYVFLGIKKQNSCILLLTVSSDNWWKILQRINRKLI